MYEVRLRKWYKAFALLAILLISVVGGVCAYSFVSEQSAIADTTQDVTVNATPEYIAVANAPAVYDFGTVTAGSTPNTGNGYFTITNSSTVNIDVSVNCTTWVSNGSAWTYNNPASDTGNLDASSANGGTGGSGGAGLFDISVPNGAAILLCDNVTTVTNPTWELELDAPTAFTHGDEQEITVTVSAVGE